MLVSAALAAFNGGARGSDSDREYGLVQVAKRDLDGKRKLLEAMKVMIRTLTKAAQEEASLEEKADREIAKHASAFGTTPAVLPAVAMLRFLEKRLPANHRARPALHEQLEGFTEQHW